MSEGRSPSPDGDPVLAQRARYDHLARQARRAGYALFGLAALILILGLVTGLNDLVTVLVVGCLAVGSVLLAPAIVVGYGVKAAERDDRRAGP